MTRKCSKRFRIYSIHLQATVYLEGSFTREKRNLIPFGQKKFYLSLDYTSTRCYKIGLSIQNTIEKVTLNFKCIVSWKTIRLSQVLGRFLKKKPEKFETNDVIYDWTCICKSRYIGQTKRRCGIRWIEHVNDKNFSKPDKLKSSIWKHLKNCPKFNEKYDNYICDPITKNFTSSYRTKTAQSEYALKFFHSNSKFAPRKFTRSDFALQYFNLLKTNLTNTRKRENTEEFLILLYNPNLNEKKDFKFCNTF